jgi:hypothetical protein
VSATMAGIEGTGARPSTSLVTRTMDRGEPRTCCRSPANRETTLREPSFEEGAAATGFRDNGRDRRHGRPAFDLAGDQYDGQRRTPATLRPLLARCQPEGQSATWRAHEQADTARGQLTPKAYPDHRRPESNDPAGNAGAGCRRAACETITPRGRGASGMPGRSLQEQRPPRIHKAPMRQRIARLTQFAPRPAETPILGPR